MAPDSKQPSAKPFTPSLSSKFRSTKSPLTPRLAGSAPHSPASAPKRDAVVRNPLPTRAKETTPVPVTTVTAALNGNITPRSGARRSRIGSESPGTPASATRVPPQPPPKPNPPTAGLGISNLSVTSPKSHTTHITNNTRSTPSTRTDPRRLSGARSTVQSDESNDAKFIRAEAARSSTRTLGSGNKTSTPGSGGKLFTAGTLQSQRITSPKQSLTNPTPNNRDSKFFHASDVNAESNPRERKVLDLEISNSSLLAINKTLERELRKQTVELRRFRRLTRSGRLSIAPAGRTVSSSTLDTVPELFDEEPSDSEPDDDASDLDEDEDNLSTSSGDPLSATFKASQRARDEKRLLLNLSRHQQMLVDSQKLTQSIRRALTCTEELIRDATKAIDYRVGIGDVKLGGRVLSTDELESHGGEADHPEEEFSHSQGLLGPGINTATATSVESAKSHKVHPATDIFRVTVLLQCLGLPDNVILYILNHADYMYWTWFKASLLHNNHLNGKFNFLPSTHINGKTICINVHAERQYHIYTTTWRITDNDNFIQKVFQGVRDSKPVAVTICACFHAWVNNVKFVKIEFNLQLVHKV
ncbi:hypothetical protein DV735_g925, partial [Chaetothyriales sp. CBS 134920]